MEEDGRNDRERWEEEERRPLKSEQRGQRKGRGRKRAKAKEER